MLCLSVTGVSCHVKHVSVLAGGLYVLYVFFELHMMWVIILSLLCYLILLLSITSRSKGVFLSLVILVYMLMGSVFEHLHFTDKNVENWSKRPLLHLSITMHNNNNIFYYIHNACSQFIHYKSVP